MFLDAKVEKVRDGGRVVQMALVIAHGVHQTGRSEILGRDVGEAETEAFWTDFLRGLVGRGMIGVQLAISYAHAWLTAATAKVLGCAWQRCTVRFLRDCSRPRAQGPARAAGRAEPEADPAAARWSITSRPVVSRGALRRPLRRRRFRRSHTGRDMRPRTAPRQRVA